MTLYQQARLLALFSKMSERVNQLKGLSQLYSGSCRTVILSNALEMDSLLMEAYRALDQDKAPQLPASANRARLTR